MVAEEVDINLVVEVVVLEEEMVVYGVVVEVEDMEHVVIEIVEATILNIIPSGLDLLEKEGFMEEMEHYMAMGIMEQTLFMMNL